MFRLTLLSSLLAGVILLPACTTPSHTENVEAAPVASARITPQQAYLAPISFAQATPPQGYRFKANPRTVRGTAQMIGNTPVTDMAPVELIPDKETVNVAYRPGRAETLR